LPGFLAVQEIALKGGGTIKVSKYRFRQRKRESQEGLKHMENKAVRQQEKPVRGQLVTVSGLVRGFGLGLAGRSGLLFCLSKAPKGVYDHRREAAHYSGYSAAGETGFCKINARYNAARSKYERKYLAYNGDNQIRKRNSVFGLNIGGIMGFRHTHYPFRKGRTGVFVPFQHFRLRKGALKKFSCMNGSLNDGLGLIHEFPSKTFACFSAGHQKTLLWRPEDYSPSGKTNPPPPPMRSLWTDSLNKGPDRGGAAQLKPFLLKSHSYLKYKAYHYLIQPSSNYRQIIEAPRSPVTFPKGGFSVIIKP
jgi:hypothetical protein